MLYTALGLLVATLILSLLIGVLEQRERDERLAAHALDTARLLDKSLNERLREIDQYRHDLAAVLQQLDLEKVRAAERDADTDCSNDEQART